VQQPLCAGGWLRSEQRRGASSLRGLRLWETWAGPLAFVLALVSALCGLFGAGENFYGIASIAWLIVALLFSIRTSLAARLEKLFASSGFKSESRFFEQRLLEYVENSTRLQKASTGLILERFEKQGGLNQHLLKVVSLAFREFQANSAELSLYDRDSGLWSQSLVLGEPSSVNAQAMLSEGSSTDLLETVSDNDQRVIKQDMEFSGTNFGTIRVEMPNSREVSEEDRQVLSLLGLSGAMLLVDAQFTKEIIRLRSASEDSVKAKTGFLANLSHEIRGPLGVILNGVELTMDGLCGPVTETQVETLQMIKNNGDHLLDLVNDVLDYAKVEAGKISANPIALSADELLDDLATLVRSQAQAKGHSLKVEGLKGKLALLCDRRHIRQILINFLTNAIKYTPDGGKVSLGAELDGPDRVKIWVKDSGVGIPEEARASVFGAFERVENKYSNAQVGTGLGMSLTKRLAEVNAAVVESDDAQKDDSHDEIIVEGAGDKILLVDHIDETREMYATYLENLGFQVFAAGSGSEVLKTVREHELDLAIIENDLPDISGEDLVFALRANPRVARMPIVVISSKAFIFDIEHLLRSGVDRCLSKPIELSELARNSRRLIDDKRREYT